MTTQRTPAQRAWRNEMDRRFRADTRAARAWAAQRAIERHAEDVEKALRLLASVHPVTPADEAMLRECPSAVVLLIGDTLRLRTAMDDEARRQFVERVEQLKARALPAVAGGAGGEKR